MALARYHSMMLAVLSACAISSVDAFGSMRHAPSQHVGAMVRTPMIAANDPLPCRLSTRLHQQRLRDDDKHERTTAEIDLVQKARSTAMASMIAVSLLFSGGGDVPGPVLAPGTTTGELHFLERIVIQPPSAYADAVESIAPVTPTASTVTPKVVATKIQQEPSKMEVFEEVWGLLDKYFIERSFHGQDWNQIHQEYRAKVEKLDKGEDVMKVVTQLVQSLNDKYTRVLDADAYARIQKFDLIGVGATLMPNNGKIMVGAPPIPNSAADLNGMKYGDYILAVNGQSTTDRSAFDIIDQISEDNPNAPTITMTVLTKGERNNNNGNSMESLENGIDNDSNDYVRDLELKRGFAKVTDPVEYHLQVRSDGTRVGYVRLQEFNSLAKRSLQKALTTLENDDKADAYVLDMRGNPGGAFQGAVEIASLFMDNALATKVVDANKVEMPFRTAKDKVVPSMRHPMAVWLDGGSASASEVLAGALRDNCRAAVMGDPSFGKGLIQAVYGLKNGSGLVVTVARYTTPQGTDIQGTGIQPDFPSKGNLPPAFIPMLSSDTSKVDFTEIQKRLDPAVCPAPLS